MLPSLNSSSGVMPSQARSVDNSVQGGGGTEHDSPPGSAKAGGELAHPRVRAAVVKLGLTQRESQIVEKFAAGKSTQALAEELYISAATVRTHLRKIFTKLDICSRVELLSLVLTKVLEATEASTEEK